VYGGNISVQQLSPRGGNVAWTIVRATTRAKRDTSAIKRAYKRFWSDCGAFSREGREAMKSVPLFKTRAAPVSLALCLAVKIRPKQRLCACGHISRIKPVKPTLERARLTSDI